MKKAYILFLFPFLAIACAKQNLDTVMDSKENQPNMSITNEDFRHTAPEAGPARKIQMGKAETFEMANGLTVIVVENHKLPTISYQLTLKNEPIIEGDQKGFVDMAGNLLSRGTHTKTKAEIDEAIDFIGASFNTSPTGFFTSSLKKHSDALLNVVTDVLYNASFLAEEMEKLRKQDLSALETVKTDPNSMASNVSSIVNYGTDHPYGEVQTVASTKNITLESCKSYYERFFIPNNAYLTIVGDITLNEAKDQADKYFGKWKKKPFKPVVNKKVAAPDERRVSFVNKEGAVQSVIEITYPVDLELGHPDRIKATIMNSIVGGFTQRLFNNLREDKGYTYTVFSSLSADPIVGNFRASSPVRNEVTDSSITQFIYEFERIRSEKVGEEELQAVKNYRTGSFARSLESPQTVARFALNTIRYGLPSDYYETYLEKLDAVTIDDIHMMAQKYILPSRANIVVVGNKDEVAKKLLQFDADGKIDYYDAFGNSVEFGVEVPAGAKAETVITDYLDAIGGTDKLRGIGALLIKMSAEVMGQSIQATIRQKAPNKFSMVVGNGSMVFQEQVFNGEKAKTSAMGQDQVFTEGPEFDAMKGQSLMFPQLHYLTPAYKLDLKGVESVDGVQCYKIAIEKENGQLSTEFYSLESGLLVRSISTQENMGQKITVTNDFSEYEEEDGLMFPRMTKISGAMPMTLEMKVEEIIINADIEDSVFSID